VNAKARWTPDPRAPRKRRDPGQLLPASTGWTVFSYLAGGMLLYGALGWLAMRWTHLAVLFPVGMIVGLGLATALVIFRYAKH
jgi:ATP synthase protein I